MKMPLSQQAAELVGKHELVILTERVDEVALLIGPSSLPRRKGDGQDGLAGGIGAAYPPPWEATGAQLGLDGGDVAGIYPHRRRSPQGVG